MVRCVIQDFCVLAVADVINERRKRKWKKSERIIQMKMKNQHHELVMVADMVVKQGYYVQVDLYVIRGGNLHGRD